MDTKDNTSQAPTTESRVDGNAKFSTDRLKEMAKSCHLDGLSIRALRDEGHAELDAESNDKQKRRQALDELVAQAQELDMGY